MLPPLRLGCGRCLLGAHGAAAMSGRPGLPGVLKPRQPSRSFQAKNMSEAQPRNNPDFKFDSYLWRRGTSSTSNSTVDAPEVAKFEALAAEWWNPSGPLSPLHALNRLRVQLVRDGMQATGFAKSECPQPLKELQILDVGCGGGIFSEALARLGAQVTALDAAEENVKVASTHSADDPDLSSRLSYVCSTVEDFYRDNPEARFDAVVASEVLEHVNNQALFVKTCADLTKSSGSLFFTTLNRTQRSYLAGIVAAECILGLVPVGTHDWDKFVTPEELDSWLIDSSCHTRLVHGLFYLPVWNKWQWVTDCGVNYALHAIKNAEDEK